MKRLFEEITDFVLGTRYYAVIIGERGSDRYYVASEIHTTRASAEAHRSRIEQTRTFIYITTITFRSKRLNFWSSESQMMLASIWPSRDKNQRS